MSNYGYARTSTFEQAAGLADQVKRLKASGCGTVFEEQVSATDMEGRKQWRLMMDSLRPGDTVTITKIDRAARSLADMVAITKAIMDAGASLRVLDMDLDTRTPTGALMLNVLSSVAQFERDLMLERQRVGIEAAKARDKTLPLAERAYKGAPPKARAKIDSIKALLAAGKSKAQAARDLNIGIASVYRLLKEDAARQGK
jgi:DNA invertase Pin-like site-specific DNA recombinase